jgi:riboflavin synthase
MAETLRITNLAELAVGNDVNFERAARIGDEIGGHLVSGHIHSKATILEIQKAPHNCTLVFKIEKDWMKYILPKGFISINGASLTIGETITDDTFCVHLIPETLAMTTFGSARQGDTVNIEIDSNTQTIVTTLEKMGLLRR